MVCWLWSWALSGLKNEALATVCSRSLTPDEQRSWVADVRAVLEQAPLRRPETPFARKMRVKVSNAGTLGWWGGLGYGYAYYPHQPNTQPWPEMPSRWRDLATEIAGDHSWDCAVINWYAPAAGLGWHRDKSERDTSLPIVTVSLGDACSWAVRRHDEAPVSRCRLESGAITLLVGSTRNYHHTVERIIPTPLFSPLSKRGRISITMRVAG